MKENKYKKYIYLIEYHIGNNIDFVRYKLLPLIIEQKILSAIIGIIILTTGAILLIPASGRNKEKSTLQLPAIVSQLLKLSPTPSNQVIEDIILKPSIPEQKNPTPQPIVSRQPKASPVIISLRNSPTVKNQTPTQGLVQPTSARGAIQLIRQSATITAPGGSSPATRGATSTPMPTSYVIATNPPQIVFIGPDGQQQTYTPPATPPIEITWTRYTNVQDHYTIEYPANWQIIIEDNEGQERVFVYMPGADPDDPNTEYIKFGMSSSFTPPQANYSGQFVLHGVQGTIYTNGAAGTSYIAAALKYTNGFLVLNNNITEEVFLYVFNHMLYSIELDPS